LWNDDHIARSCLKVCAQRCYLPEIAFLQHDLIDLPLRFPFKKFSRSIDRSVIHDDDFDVLDRRCANCFSYRFNRRSLIITKDNDGLKPDCDG
jgi:hypothetical protein